MNRFFLKENKILNISIIILFCIFFFTWTKHGGAWVYGLYSEVDGQLSAWLSKYLFLWASPFDMTSINPFQGMGSIINPINSWWNPGAFPLILPFSEKINYSLSYSIYWLEIFCAIYFLAEWKY